MEEEGEEAACAKNRVAREIQRLGGGGGGEPLLPPPGPPPARAGAPPPPRRDPAHC
eukprot:COSAG06_NODE_65183_length_257_cov_1.379747_1_plen_55_part_10